MNDEIKEILEYFKDDIDYLEEELKYPNFKGRYITIRDKECEYLRKLLDYITNLQTDNKRLQHNEKVFKGRNEKAIDKLNTQLAFTSSYQLNYQSAMNIIEETKSILQGVDKE